MPARSVKEQFAARLYPLAQAVEKEWGIKPAIIVAQAALESAWGVSQLADEYNNLFGMTGLAWVQHGWPVIYMPTHEWDAHPPDEIHYWNVPGDIKTKVPNPKGGTDLIVNVPFRRYASWDDSLADWAKMIGTAPKYAAAYAAAKAGDLIQFAAEMKRAKYASNPDYQDCLAALAADPVIKGVSV